MEDTLFKSGCCHQSLCRALVSPGIPEEPPLMHARRGECVHIFATWQQARAWRQRYKNASVTATHNFGCAAAIILHPTPSFGRGHEGYEINGESLRLRRARNRHPFWRGGGGGSRGVFSWMPKAADKKQSSCNKFPTGKNQQQQHSDTFLLPL